MTLNYDIPFILTHISTLSVMIMLFLIVRTKNKSQIHYIFLSIIILLLFWNIGTMLEIYFRQIFKYTEMIFVNISYLGICFIPVFILLLALSFSNTNLKFNFYQSLLFIVPIITTLIIWTNQYHNLFFINYSIYSSNAIYGTYYIFHSIYSYSCILIGLVYLGIFTMKISGFFSRQFLLILFGILVPLVINILYSFNLANLAFNINSIAFTFSIICFSTAIIKFNFLDTVPIALQKIVDLISDSYIVINTSMEIIDFNKTFINTFDDMLTFKRKDNFIDVIENSPVQILSPKKMLRYNKYARENNKPITFNTSIQWEDNQMFFSIEITPIFSKLQYIGSILLFKDITQSKKDLQTIRENHEIIMQQEKLASLGQLIGGIAHNLKTPIMSIAGAVEGLRELVEEYDESIEDPEVTDADHHEISKEMLVWVEKIKPHCAYMSDVITAVKDQAVVMNASSQLGFTLLELIRRIEILMKHQLLISNCVLNVDCSANKETHLSGDMNSLVQVFDNLIINSIHAYEGKDGKITFRIVYEENYISFKIIDYGKGISEEIKNKLFNEMVTTKGKEGTGLGLFMSYSTIVGNFNGKMWFDSKLGEGTEFTILIPVNNI